MLVPQAVFAEVTNETDTAVAGSEMVTVVEVVQPPLSVIVIVYVPAANPLTESGTELFVVV